TRMSRAPGRREYGSRAEIAGNAEKKWHRPPSFAHDREAEGGWPAHLFSAIFALSARDSYSPRSRRARFCTKPRLAISDSAALLSLQRLRAALRPRRTGRQDSPCPCRRDRLGDKDARETPT